VSNSKAGWRGPRLLGSAFSRRDSRVAHTSGRLLSWCVRLCIGMWVARTNTLRAIAFGRRAAFADSTSLTAPSGSRGVLRVFSAW
jgi:hypothetical protein